MQGEASRGADELDPEDDVGVWHRGKWRLANKAKEQELALKLSISSEQLKIKQEEDFINEKLAAYRIRLDHFLEAHAGSFLNFIAKEMLRYMKSYSDSLQLDTYALGVVSAVCSSFKDPLFLEISHIRRAMEMLGIPISSSDEEDIRNLGNGKVVHLSNLCDYFVANALILCSRSLMRRSRLILGLSLLLGFGKLWRPSECFLRDILIEKERKRLVFESRTQPFKEPPGYALIFFGMTLLRNL